jgi:hypothetical protein
LKSAEYRFRLPVIQVRPCQEQTELKPLSEFGGPPHRGPMGGAAYGTPRNAATLSIQTPRMLPNAV